jgi:transposase
MSYIQYNSPKWFNLNTAKLLDVYDDSFNRIEFIKKDRNIKTSIFKTNNEPVIEIQKNPSFLSIIDEELDKTCNKYKNKILKTDNPIKIKTLSTKFMKEMNQIGTVTRVKKFIIHFNKRQSKIIQDWILDCKKVYNFCVDKLNTDNKYFNEGFMSVLSDIFNGVFGNKPKTTPFDVLGDEVRVFCSNLKSCFTNLKNKNIKKFKMGKKSYVKDNYSLLIRSKAIHKSGIYTTILGHIKKFNINDEITHDCRLFYNKHQNNYTLMIPTDIRCNYNYNKEQICAIDPGEKKFIQFAGLQSYGYIGKNMRKVLLKNRNKISKYQKILSKKKNKKGNKLRNRKHIRKKIRKLHKKNKNIVKELHNQAANYLCKNFNKILIPKFETQNMITHKKTFKQHKLDEINKGETLEAKKTIAKKFTKRCRLNRNVKYVLNNLSHYQFRQHLLNKAKEYGCIVKIISEEYTSCTCSKCGHMSDNYEYRIKKCAKCGYEIDRDLNGAKNILIKNIKMFMK